MGRVDVAEEVAPFLFHVARQVQRVDVAHGLTVDRRDADVGGERDAVVVEFFAHFVELHHASDVVGRLGAQQDRVDRRQVVAGSGAQDW